MGFDPRYVWENGVAVVKRAVVAAQGRSRRRPCSAAWPSGGDQPRAHGHRPTGAARVDHRHLELVSDPGGVLDIGEATLVNFGCSLVATELVRIGADCHIGPYTMMLDNDFHRVEPERRLERPPSKPIIVEDNVWIGARSILMPGVTVGRDSCIGAGSVVTASVQPRTLAAGVPARPIREL